MGTDAALFSHTVHRLVACVVWWPDAHTHSCYSSQAMIVELRRCPTADTLAGLKESLDFASSAWGQLFCTMGGAQLLSDALAQHLSFTEVTPHTLPT